MANYAKFHHVKLGTRNTPEATVSLTLEDEVNLQVSTSEKKLNTDDNNNFMRKHGLYRQKYLLLREQTYLSVYKLRGKMLR
jgi:hypothetical protein